MVAGAQYNPFDNAWNRWNGVVGQVENDVGRAVNEVGQAVNEYDEAVSRINKYSKFGKAFSVVISIVAIASAAAFFNPVVAVITGITLVMCYDIWRFSDNCENLVANPLNLLLSRNQINEKLRAKTVFIRLFNIGMM